MLCVLPPQTGTGQIRNVAGNADMSGNNFFVFIWIVGVGFINVLNKIPAFYFAYFWPKPDGDGQTAVMNHVQGREVRKLFPRHKEERIEKIDKLREVVPPCHVQGSQTNFAEIQELNVYSQAHCLLFPHPE